MEDILMRKFFSVLPILFLMAWTTGCGSMIQMSQPTVVGQPGRVFESTTATVSVDIINNTRFVADILVGETVVYEGVRPTQIKNIGFSCGNMIILEERTLRLRSNGSRSENIYFRTQDGQHQVLSRPISIQCGYRSTQQWDINYVQSLR
jgi:hypothetical protein